MLFGQKMLNKFEQLAGAYYLDEAEKCSLFTGPAVCVTQHHEGDEELPDSLLRDGLAL